MERVYITVSIDTEEDNWGSFARFGATTKNVLQLPGLQDLLDRYGVRPTYLVNAPPLQDPEAVRVLGELARRPEIEIGAHCHPWNTPPYDPAEPEEPEDGEDTMMWTLPFGWNLRKVRELSRTIEDRLGVRPTTFRSGRWSFGPSVARAIAENGFLVDASVTPFLDWTEIGGPDYSTAPHLPYRFDPGRPMDPDPRGSLVELPTTVGFLGTDGRRVARLRHRLENSLLGSFKIVGLFDRLGLLQRRWLAPEWSTGDELVRLADACVEGGRRVLAFTCHSCALLPGATPFVSDEEDRRRFLDRIDRFLSHCVERGWEFATLGEMGRTIGPDPEGGPPASGTRAGPGAEPEASEP